MIVRIPLPPAGEGRVRVNVFFTESLKRTLFTDSDTR